MTFQEWWAKNSARISAQNGDREAFADCWNAAIAYGNTHPVVALEPNVPESIIEIDEDGNVHGEIEILIPKRKGKPARANAGKHLTR